MKTYKRVVTFCVGLCVVLIFGALNALFMTPNTPWYQSLVLPKFNLSLFGAGWFFAYISIAFIISEYLLEKFLRRKFLFPLFVVLGNALFCGIFFRLNSAIAGSIIVAVILLDILYMTATTMKKYPVTAFVLTFLACWYIYILGLTVYIMIIN